MSKVIRSDALHEELMIESLKKGGYSEHDIEEAKKNWETTKSLLPKDFDKLNSSNDCLFCKGDIKGERQSYANITLAHEEPTTFKKTLLSLGKKNVKSQIGSLVPAYIAICNRCKRVLRMVELVKWLVTLILTGVSFIVLGFLNSIGILEKTSQLVPYVVVLGSAILGYILGKVVSAAYSKAKSETVHLNVFDLDILKEMKEKGWFLLQDDKGSTSVNFDRTPGNFGRVFEE